MSCTRVPPPQQEDSSSGSEHTVATRGITLICVAVRTMMRRRGFVLVWYRCPQSKRLAGAQFGRAVFTATHSLARQCGSQRKLAAAVNPDMECSEILTIRAMAEKKLDTKSTNKPEPIGREPLCPSVEQYIAPLRVAPLDSSKMTESLQTCLHLAQVPVWTNVHGGHLL